MKITLDQETYNEILGTLQILSNLTDRKRYPEQVKDGFDLLDNLLLKLDIEEMCSR